MEKDNQTKCKQKDFEAEKNIDDMNDSSTLAENDKDFEKHNESCESNAENEETKPDDRASSTISKIESQQISNDEQKESYSTNNKIRDEDEVEVEVDELPTLLEIKSKIEILHEEFQEKIKYDLHKNRVIDELHSELQSYKNDLAKTFLKPMVMSIIHAIDGIRKLSHYHHKNLESLDIQKLLKQFDDIPLEFEDLLYTHGIEPFTCDEENFNPKRQKVLKTCEVSDKFLDKKIKERIRPGYKWDEMILRPEMVTVNVFKYTDQVE